MLPHKTIAVFSVSFLLFFGLSLVPWPGLPAVCGGYFRAVGSLVFDSKTGPRSLEFEPHEAHDTRIVIINRELMQPDGSGPVRNLDLDSFGFTWRPVSLLFALILASPVSWPRRARALVAGGVCLQGFLLLVLGFSIWNQSTEIALVTLSPFWKQTAENISHILVGQLNIASPFLIWLVVTFRREDFEDFFAGTSAAKGRILGTGKK
ncbi:MAG TPA: hypothetical protein VNW30_08325 [Opitutaceae bacterium]|jgi:hypothetical protein|nr:hypothetical protein [Opitutaceae bacterium]